MLIVKKSAAKVHILYYNEECGGRVVKRNAEFLRFFIIWFSHFLVLKFLVFEFLGRTNLF